MIRRLDMADFRCMPWVNGKGMTMELARVDRNDALLWRLSRASVVEDGPFSIFPGVNRNLTVLTGTGFDLVGNGIHLPAYPFVPVAFPGDMPIRAQGVIAPCDDFNVMTGQDLPPPEVHVLTSACRAIPPQGGLLAVYEPVANNLILADEAFDFNGETPALAVRIFF